MDRKVIVSGDARSGIRGEIHGFGDIIGKLRALGGERAIQALAGELYREAEEIMADSKDNEVPVKTGALKSTGFVPEPIIAGSQVTQTAGYGGPAAEYALIQHERLDFNHKFKRHEVEGGRPGKAKYLSDPFARKTDGMVERVGAGVARALGL